NSMRSFEEIGVYLQMLSNYARNTAPNPNLPFIHVGRSMGSTDAFMDALMAQAEGIETVTDLYFATSFSNPETFEEQNENVQAQLARGDIAGILQDALDHADVNTIDLQRKLEHLRQSRPNILKTFSDRMVFVQGEADEDGGNNV